LIGGSIALLALAAEPVRAHEEPTAWTSFQGGPAHLGAKHGIRPGLRSAWRVASGGDTRLSVPVVVPGLAVAVGASHVLGFDPVTGRALWTVDRARGPIVPPAIEPSTGENGVVVYTEGSNRSTSALVAIDASTRDRRWRLALGNLSRSAPVIAGGRVYLGARDRAVYAVDLASGTVAWKARTQGRVDPSVAVADGAVFAVSENPTSGRAALDAFDAVTGKRRWTFSPARLPAGATAPMVAEGLVYAGFGDGTVRAITAATGSERWSEAVRTDFNPLSSPAFTGGLVFVLDRDGGLYAFDGQTGRRRWDYQFDAAADCGPVSSQDVGPNCGPSPLASEGAVFIGLDDGTVAAVDAGIGHLVWRDRLGSGPLGPLAVAGELLLVPSIGTRGGVTAFRHDPTVPLVDLASPTELRFGPALLGYVAGVAATLIVLLGGFRLLTRRRGGPVIPEAPPPGWSPGDSPRAEGGPSDDGGLSRDGAAAGGRAPPGGGRP
jgi:outer membrane protein assembly factor BamB